MCHSCLFRCACRSNSEEKWRRYRESTNKGYPDNSAKDRSANDTSAKPEACECQQCERDNTVNSANETTVRRSSVRRSGVRMRLKCERTKLRNDSNRKSCEAAASAFLSCCHSHCCRIFSHRCRIALLVGPAKKKLAKSHFKAFRNAHNFTVSSSVSSSKTNLR